MPSARSPMAEIKEVPVILSLGAGVDNLRRIPLAHIGDPLRATKEPATSLRTLHSAATQQGP